MIASTNQCLINAAILKIINCLSTILCAFVILVNLHFSTRYFLANLDIGVIKVSIVFEPRGCIFTGSVIPRKSGIRNDDLVRWLNAVGDSALLLSKLLERSSSDMSEERMNWFESLILYLLNRT
ncbi:hypothetical protein AVEN_43459-1 [Araneus ventricosus]|uniref:Uncharacterized protein n=1 Tax=Araneus ventricosus TaxID=182803 RepID=A0A4Y2W7U2_ARAVE|nr:hypothetical protein AVEN_43459-1 [Araneus ventricosus]